MLNIIKFLLKYRIMFWFQIKSNRTYNKIFLIGKITKAKNVVIRDFYQIGVKENFIFSEIDKNNIHYIDGFTVPNFKGFVNLYRLTFIKN